VPDDNKKNIHIEQEEEESIGEVKINDQELPETKEAGINIDEISLEDSLMEKEKILSSEVEKYKKLAEENFKLYQYSLAELDNLKKRALQDRGEYRKYGIIPFVKEILHVVDNLERALEHLENADKESLTKGIKMTLEQFNKSLEKFGIKEIHAVGEVFDPNFHEALLMVESQEHKPNKIVDELQKGYILDDKLVRPSKVAVSAPSKKKEEEA
jgi:molecular chaperone GrpE